MSDELNAAQGIGGDDAVDDELLAELRALVTRHDPVPSEALAAARSAIAWRTLDAELADLADESEMAGVRGVGTPTLLTFDATGLTVEVELLVVGGHRRLLGQLVPPGPGNVDVRHGNRTVSTAADEVGRFSVDDIVPGPVSLRCSIDGRLVVTDWFLV